MVSNPSTLIADFVQVAALSGFSLSEKEITHELLPAPHQSSTLPSNKQAVYVFSLSTPLSRVLKVGRVGPNSSPRFKTQHYNPNSSRSNLAKSLLNRTDLWSQFGIQTLGEESVGEWIKRNTDRDNFLISSDQNTLLLCLLEVFLQCRLQPLFEG